MATQFRAQLSTLGASIAQPFQAGLAPIQQTGNALANLRGQLAQTNTGFVQTAASGNRFAELFRGNRGLIFGLSATFGTITGVVFELQLMDDANKQVADSQAAVNELIASGQQGTAQYQQAMQALGKDQRFLAFATRNLALAFTNFIPDIILVINGMLSLKDRIAGVAGATGLGSLGIGMQRAGTQMRAFATETVAARDALAGLNIVSGGGAVGGVGGVGRLGGILGGIGSLLSIAGPIGLAIGGVIAVITLLIQKSKEMDQAMVDSMNASKSASEGRISDAKSWLDVTLQSWGNGKEAMDSFTSAHTSDTDTIVANYQRISNAAANTQVVPGAVAPKGQTVEDLGTADQSKGLNVLGGVGDWFAKLGDPFKNFTQEGQDKSSATVRLLHRAPSTIGQILAAGGFSAAEGGITWGQGTGLQGYGRSVPGMSAMEQTINQMGWSTAIQTARNEAARRGLNASLQGGLNIEGLGNFPIPGLLTGPEYLQVQGLAREAGAAKAKIPKIPEGQAGAGGLDFRSEEAAKYAEIIGQIVDITTDLTDVEENENRAKEAMMQTLKTTMAAQNQYNQVLEGMPRILQETGQAHKFLTPELYKQQQTLIDSAAAYVDYGLATAQAGTLTKQQESLLQAIVAVGNQVVTGLYEQRDAIQAVNIFWGNMNATTKEQIATTQKQILASIDVTKALTNQNYQQYLTNQGMIEGKLAAQQWLDGMIQSIAAEKELHTQTQAIVAQMGVELPKGILLSTEQLQMFAEEFRRTGDTAESEMIVFEEAFAAARAGVEELVAAAVEGGKEFRDAWKDVNKDFIPKGEGGEVKNFIKDLADVRQAVDDAATSIGLFQHLWAFGMLDDKELKKWSNEAMEALRGIRSELEDLGPLGDTIGKAIVDPFIKLKEDGLTEAELNVISQFVTKFQELASKPGGIQPEHLAVLESYGDKLLETLKAQEKFIEKGKDVGATISFSPSGSGVTIKPDKPLTEEEYQEQAKKLGKPPLQPRKDDEVDKREAQKLIDELNKTIPAAAQKAQTAIANLAIQGSNSLAILAKSSSGHMQGFRNNLNVGYIAAGHLQVGIANLAVEGSKSLQLLARISSVSANGIRNNMNVAYVAAGHLQTGLANLANEGSASLQMLAKASSTAANGMKNNFNVAYSAAGHLQTGLANLANEGSKSLRKLASEASSTMSSVASSMKKAESAVDSLNDAIQSLKSKTVTVTVKTSGGGSSSGKQHGMHETLNQDQLILAHRGERVDIDTVGATIANRESKARTVGGDTVIYITMNNVTELDGEVIGTTVTRKTFRKMSTR